MGYGRILGMMAKAPEYNFDDNCKLSSVTLYVHSIGRDAEKIRQGPILTCYSRSKEREGAQLFDNINFKLNFTDHDEITPLWGGTSVETAVHSNIHGLREGNETSSTAFKHAHLLITPDPTLGEAGTVSAVVLTLATFGLITHVEAEAVNRYFAASGEWFDD